MVVSDRARHTLVVRRDGIRCDWVILAITNAPLVEHLISGAYFLRSKVSTFIFTNSKILSLVPDLLEVKLFSLCKLKSLEVDLIPLYDGLLLQLLKDAMLKKADAISPKEVAKLRKAFKARLKSHPIPDGLVDLLRQNSSSVEVKITTDFPTCFNLKQVEESIKGAKIIKYRSQFFAPASSSAAPASDVAPSSVAEPATTAPPNLHLSP
ncbi:uncharacterized protein LOC131595716 isoform X2 [Vicia villosa]|uniref:uncharacterized protein LOC131595716 isoform X2 n=1 Tax=Vicia villosa TaxID=3911 RepID=UPI00273AC5F1|nr:uncharacterized protein LOC131595716 isoform X2 [Vicia villosa]